MRRLRKILLLVLAVALLLHVAGGWYFATRIDAGALELEPWRSTRVNPVASVSDIELTLARGSDPAQVDSLTSDGTYGVQWDGGYGRISGEPLAEDSRVTRDFDLVQGTAPAEGDEVAVDVYAFPAEPPAGAREVEYDAPLGETPAVFAPGRGDVWAIFVHGRGGTVAEAYRTMQTTRALGVPTLSIGYRNDEGAPRDPSAKYWFGDTEWADLDAAVTYAREQGAAGVVLMGSSMGGAIVASYLRHRPDHAFVRGVVLDSPALSLERTVEFGAEHQAVPVPPTVTWTAQRFASLGYGLDWDDTDYLEDTGWADVPILLFHGTDDEVVPVETSRELAAAADDVTYVEVPHTGHIRAWNTDPEAYDAELRAFLEPLLR